MSFNNISKFLLKAGCGARLKFTEARSFLSMKLPKLMVLKSLSCDNISSPVVNIVSGSSDKSSFSLKILTALLYSLLIFSLSEFSSSIQTTALFLRYWNIDSLSC